MFKDLYCKCEKLVAESKMQTNEATHHAVARMVEEISFAWLEDEITEAEYDSLIDMIREGVF